jgi:hypothetical protein
VWLATFILHYLFPGISVLNITIAFEYRLLYLNEIMFKEAIYWYTGTQYIIYTGIILCIKPGHSIIRKARLFICWLYELIKACEFECLFQIQHVTHTRVLMGQVAD